MTSPLRVLIAEDSTEDAELCLHELRRAGFEPTHRRVESANDFIKALRGTWDIVLSDYTMPQFDAMDALRLLREHTDQIPFIVVTGSIDEETAVDCLKRGVDDYILKENIIRLGPATTQVLEAFEGRRERRRLEEEVRQAQKMEAIGQLASGIAHDLNNVLTAIFGYADLAKMTLPPDHEAIESLGGVEEAAKHASGIVKSLLTFSRKAVAEKGPLNLCTVVRESTRLLRHVLPAFIELTLEAVEDHRCYVNGDSTQLLQIIMNLVINARDAMMPDGGELRISVSPTSDAETSEASDAEPFFVRLNVSDTGAGMSPQVQARIFEPFFTTKDPGMGTGLGLSVVDGIVKDHGASMIVHSQEGGGTSFRIDFPHLHQNEPRAPEVSRASAKGHGELLLLAEDDKYVRSTMSSALEAREYIVIQVGDGPTFLERYREFERSVRLLILDIDLPQYSGLECLHEIRMEAAWTPAILITGNVDVALKEGDLDERTVLLRKPFQMAELMRLVNDLIRGTRES